MDVVIAAGDALRAYRLSRLPDPPIRIEPGFENPSDFPSLGYRRFAKTVAPLLEQLGLMRNGGHVCLRFPMHVNRHRVVGVNSIVTTRSLPAESFWRIIPSDPNVTRQLIRMDVRLFVDAPGLCAIANAYLFAAQVTKRDGLYKRLAPLGHTMGLVSELCGRFSLDPWDQQNTRPTYNTEPVMSLSDLQAYLGQADGVHGIALARNAASNAAEGQGSPAEVALWAGLTMQPSLGGYHFERPMANTPLSLKSYELAKIKHKRLTPDFYWKRYGIVIEYDGSDHSSGPSVWEDKARIHDYQVLGYTAFPLTSADLRSVDAFDAAVSSIVTAMEDVDGPKARRRFNGIRSDKEKRTCRSLMLSAVRTYG